MGDTEWLKLSSSRILVQVKVIPGASRSEVSGLRDGELLVRVAAAPEKGKANEELRSCLARKLGLPKSSIELVSGALSRHKRLSFPLKAEAALRNLASSMSDAASPGKGAISP
jgi:uncharacterized protein